MPSVIMNSFLRPNRSVRTRRRMRPWGLAGRGTSPGAQACRTLQETFPRRPAIFRRSRLCRGASVHEKAPDHCVQPGWSRPHPVARVWSNTTTLPRDYGRKRRPVPGDGSSRGRGRKPHCPLLTRHGTQVTERPRFRASVLALPGGSECCYTGTLAGSKCGWPADSAAACQIRAASRIIAAANGSM
jgi:hypothetical protein